MGRNTGLRFQKSTFSSYTDAFLAERFAHLCQIAFLVSLGIGLLMHSSPIWSQCSAFPNSLGCPVPCSYASEAEVDCAPGSAEATPSFPTRLASLAKVDSGGGGAVANGSFELSYWVLPFFSKELSIVWGGSKWRLLVDAGVSPIPFYSKTHPSTWLPPTAPVHNPCTMRMFNSYLKMYKLSGENAFYFLNSCL